MSYESGDFKEWTSVGDAIVYGRTYVKPTLKEKLVCGNCSKNLEAEIWYVMVNGEVFCSEECCIINYPILLGSFHKKNPDLKKAVVSEKEKVKSQ